MIGGLIKSTDYAGSQKEIFNMGSGKLASLKQILKIIGKISGKDIKLQYLSDKKENKGWVITNQQKIQSKLNWEPKVSLENGLIETYKYFDNS